MKDYYFIHYFMYADTGWFTISKIILPDMQDIPYGIGKQTCNLQSYPKTCLDLKYTAVGKQ